MEKICVHDFYFEETGMFPDGGYFVSVTVYFNFSPEDPGDGWDNWEYFNIGVANPMGIAQHLSVCMEQDIYKSPFFHSSVLFCENYHKETIMEVIKKELASIVGKSRKELLLKAMRRFSWEYEDTAAYDKLFS